MQFNQDVTFQLISIFGDLDSNNEYVSYIFDGNETIYKNLKEPTKNYTVKSYTNLEVHFDGQNYANLEDLFNPDGSGKSNFKYLISVDLSHFVISPATIMNKMFYGCSSLQSLNLSNLIRSSVTTMQGMFEGCSSLQSLDLSSFNTTSVTSMFQMFYGCSSLHTLDLSNFDTTSLTIMVNMFSGCTSLKYLIISNFNFSKDMDGGAVGGMFSNLSSLEYIDIYNISDSKNFFKNEVLGTNGLNNKDHLTVCQNNNSVFINNTNAIYDCCNIINDNLFCNNIETTIPNIQTTYPMIQTTIPLLQTTIPQMKINNPQIQTTIPRIQTTNPQIQTTIPRIQTTFPQITNGGTLLILLGFNSFKLSFSTISFTVIFILILNDIYSNLMKVHLIINYNERIRILEEKEIDCYLKKINTKKIASYFCETEIKNSNIKLVKIIPKFNFVYQNNITIIGSTPFARMFMNNIQDIDVKYDNLENSFVYILDHSSYNKYSSYKYNITGIIDQEPKSNLGDKSINLMINLESESEIATESNCTIIKIKESSYSLIYELKDNINSNLQSAISFINNEEILIVNFDSGNSTISKNNPYKKFFSKTSSLKSGEIVAIILTIVFVLAAIIGIIIYLKNKKNHDENDSSSKVESTTENL